MRSLTPTTLYADFDGQCDKLVTDDRHQFITLSVDICVYHGGHEALRRMGLSAAAEIRDTVPVCKKQTDGQTDT